MFIDCAINFKENLLMSSEEIKVYTVYDVYKLYCEHLKSANFHSSKGTIPCLKTALLRYTLPGYNLPAEKIDIAQMKEISAQKMTTLLDIQETVFSSLGDQVSSSTRRTYRSVLKKMVDWSQQQLWWKEASSTQIKPQRLKKKSRGSANNVRVTNRGKQDAYALTDQEIEIASSLQIKLSLNLE
ncbi:MAG: hypothetical protein HY785_18410 [Oscillatoriophycideae cyanobacterium NC_groundwater_1537_Pr4_S-0.65um_50_18]|nr:hypothetical protein [Oscillatoriophycideae cyanobacterium NC_groundwater_1537_Pr4_S-0.65um_50_18]